MVDDIPGLDRLDQASDAYFEQLKKVKNARFRVMLRGGLTVVGLAFGSFFILNSLSPTAYYLKKGSEPIDLGDLRSREFDKKVLEGLETNSYVAFQNDIIMFDELQSEQFSFYYSPLTNFVVCTPRQLPSKALYQARQSVIELTPFEAEVVSKKLAFADDVKVSFDGRGRLFRFSDAPSWADSVFSFMANSSGVPQENMFLFMDGDDPEDHALHFALIVGASLLMLGTLAFFIDALVRYRKARRLFAQAGLTPDLGR